MSDMFQLIDLDDLKTELRRQVRPNGLREDSKKLLSLFALRNELSVDELLVGLYRKYGMSKKRSWVTSTVYNLKRKNLLQDVDGKKQTYCRIEEDKND